MTLYLIQSLHRHRHCRHSLRKLILFGSQLIITHGEQGKSKWPVGTVQSQLTKRGILPGAYAVLERKRSEVRRRRKKKKVLE